MRAKSVKPAGASPLKRGLKILRIILCVLLALLLGASVVVWAFVACPWGVFAVDNPYLAERAQEPYFIKAGSRYVYNPDIYNVLLLGADTDNGDEDDVLAGQADVIVLASLNKKTKQLHLLQIPRDTFVPVRSYNMLGEFLLENRGPICTAYAYGDGGITSGQMMQSAVSDLLYGIPIHRFVSVGIDSISILATLLGGVPVYGYGEFAEIWDLPQDGSPLILHGEMAEAFVRLRSLPGMTGSDQNRMARQKEFFTSALAIIKENTKAEPLYPLRFLSDFQDMSTYSSDLSFRELAFFVSGIIVSDFQTASLEGKIIPCTTGQAEYEFIPDESSLRAYIQETYFIPEA